MTGILKCSGVLINTLKMNITIVNYVVRSYVMWRARCVSLILPMTILNFWCWGQNILGYGNKVSSVTALMPGSLHCQIISNHMNMWVKPVSVILKEECQQLSQCQEMIKNAKFTSYSQRNNSTRHGLKLCETIWALETTKIGYLMNCGPCGLPVWVDARRLRSLGCTLTDENCATDVAEPSPWDLTRSVLSLEMVR